jgi:hypothetical protein
MMVAKLGEMLLGCLQGACRKKRPSVHSYKRAPVHAKPLVFREGTLFLSFLYNNYLLSLIGAQTNWQN